MGSTANGATISDCGHYRYALWRSIEVELLGKTQGTVLFVMLNPSTADASADDPTLTRCRGFARRLGYERLLVGNLFAYRATDPRELVKAEDPIGPDNLFWLHRLGMLADDVIVAWGVPAIKLGDHLDRVLGALGRGELLALGTTANGQPKHPLARGRHRIPDTAEPEAWSP